MSTAICPGSFDPVTMGHMDVILRCAKIFDRVVVCVSHNSTKSKPMFTEDEKLSMLRKVLEPYDNITVDLTEGLLAEFVKKYDDAVLVKGLRAASDFEYEFQMNLINKRINPQLDTMFVTASEKYTFLSSSVVREMAMYGADLTGLVPDEIIDDIQKKAIEWRRING